MIIFQFLQWFSEYKSIFLNWKPVRDSIVLNSETPRNPQWKVKRKSPSQYLHARTMKKIVTIVSVGLVHLLNYLPNRNLLRKSPSGIRPLEHRPIIIFTRPCWPGAQLWCLRGAPSFRLPGAIQLQYGQLSQGELWDWCMKPTSSTVCFTFRTIPSTFDSLKLYRKLNYFKYLLFYIFV